MSVDLQDPRFSDETAAREALEAIVWPNGPTCPHCGNVDQTKLAKLATKSVRPGLYYCNECKKQFTATVGTIFERSKVPLTKWWLAMHLIGSSKKGISSHQLHRMLGVSYKSTWFMMHRIRKAMRAGGLTPLGGKGEIVEVDETYIGRKEGFEDKRGFGHKNEALAIRMQCSLSLMKGVYQHCGEKHLHYLAEFDFRYSNRSAVGVEDAERVALIVEGAKGKRLQYRRPDESALA
jgi:transposase-like protein